jgi:hypothetical protein
MRDMRDWFGYAGAVMIALAAGLVTRRSIIIALVLYGIVIVFAAEAWHRSKAFSCVLVASATLMGLSRGIAPRWSAAPTWAAIISFVAFIFVYWHVTR